MSATLKQLEAKRRELLSKRGTREELAEIDRELAEVKRQISHRLRTPAGVGDLATLSYPSDCYPYTVIAISKSGHRVTLQARKAKRTDKNGQSEDQSYITVEDPNGGIVIATRRKDGGYRVKGGSSPITFGIARKFQHPSV